MRTSSKFPDGEQADRVESERNDALESLKSIVAVLPCIHFYRGPEVLNVIELTVKLRVEDNLVALFLDGLLNPTLLGEKIRLLRKISTKDCALR
jgi:hypothetical protein